MLWGIITQTNVDHAELLWEEFTQGIQEFFSHKASYKASMRTKKKVTPLLIPYGRFSKVIIYYLASNNNIHRRPDSAVHHTGDDYVLGNLKFVPKCIIQRSGEWLPVNTKVNPQKVQAWQSATKRATPKKPTTTTPVKTIQARSSSDKETLQAYAPQEEGEVPDLELAQADDGLESASRKEEGEGDDVKWNEAI
ncbi:hypothetical protein Tco_0140256 [Tanacetum coccineum]